MVDNQLLGHVMTSFPINSGAMALHHYPAPRMQGNVIGCVCPYKLYRCLCHKMARI